MTWDFTKRLYQVGFFLLVLLMLFFPYAYKADVAIKLGKLFLLPPVIVSVVFSVKFKGSMRSLDNKNFVILHLCSAFLPVLYYFMLRNAFRPNIFFFIALSAILALMTGALFLDNEPVKGIFKYSVEVVEKDTDIT